MVTLLDDAVTSHAYLKERLRVDQLCVFFRVCVHDVVCDQPSCATTVTS